jgi:DNA processing protein
VISGLARGIDTTAHRSTLDSGGRTIAVIGSGIDLIYPPENVPLADRIATNGAVVSEFKMGAKPDAVNFPRRNRIISGISLGTLVIETGIEGGAMITAATALDQNREVFAVPGPVDSQKRSGTHLLIKEGRATLVEGIEDILVELTPRFKHLSLVKTRVSRQSPPADLTLFEQQVYLVLGNEPLHIDSLALSAGIPTADALVQLLSLELKGIVRQLPGKHFVRV